MPIHVRLDDKVFSRGLPIPIQKYSKLTILTPRPIMGLAEEPELGEKKEFAELIHLQSLELNSMIT